MLNADPVFVVVSISSNSDAALVAQATKDIQSGFQRIAQVRLSERANANAPTVEKLPLFGFSDNRRKYELSEQVNRRNISVSGCVPTLWSIRR